MRLLVSEFTLLRDRYMEIHPVSFSWGTALRHSSRMTKRNTYEKLSALPPTPQKVHERPVLELRCGGLHLTIQRVPAWFVTLVTTATGAAAAWWAGR